MDGQPDSISILFDDTITGAGDGYAIDFVKLLINVKGFTYTGKIYGKVTDKSSGLPIENAVVSASGSMPVYTDAEGNYEIPDLPAGLVVVKATKFSYDTASATIDLKAGNEKEQNFQINEILEAEFSGTPLSGPSPLTVQFTDLSSKNPTSWLWDFGDGDTSVLQHPAHTYTTDGVYTVKLTASDSVETNTKTKTNYIKVGISAIDDRMSVIDLTISPNPSGNHFNVSYFLPEKAIVNISLLDHLGRNVRNLFNEMQPAGEKTLRLDPGDLPAGIYFVRITTGNRAGIRKMIRL